MAGRKKINDIKAAVDNPTAASAVIKETVMETPVESKTVEIKDAELKDSDEIEVVALVGNIRYKDPTTGDPYRWDNPGDIERMTFAALKTMWRNSKGYFRDLWLKPDDDRVISHFGLTNNYAKYEKLMSGTTYTRGSIDDVCKTILGMPNGLTGVILNKIKTLVINGEIADIVVIRTLEKRLDLDLISNL